MLELSPFQRRFLKAQAHHLNPVVMIGDQGLTPAVLKETEAALAAHELIKIKIHSDEREERDSLMEEICTQTGATPVQHIGKILVIYKAAKKPKITLPKE
jgi:RNA-binding protein